MDLINGFILGALAIGFLWALRELERRHWFEDISEEIETLRGRDRRAREMLGSLYVRLRATNDEFSLSGKVALPASAMPKAEGLELQHVSQPFARRITAKLNGLPGSGSPVFAGGSHEQR
jgi:hypothetical protein